LALAMTREEILALAMSKITKTELNKEQRHIRASCP
jgi:hypothetical protein